eukprot:858611-Amphidinium_carterae.2
MVNPLCSNTSERSYNQSFLRQLETPCTLDHLVQQGLQPCQPEALVCLCRRNRSSMRLKVTQNNIQEPEHDTEKIRRTPRFLYKSVQTPPDQTRPAKLGCLFGRLISDPLHSILPAKSQGRVFLPILQLYDPFYEARQA